MVFGSNVLSMRAHCRSSKEAMRHQVSCLVATSWGLSHTKYKGCYTKSRYWVLSQARPVLPGHILCGMLNMLSASTLSSSGIIMMHRTKSIEYDNTMIAVA